MFFHYDEFKNWFSKNKTRNLLVTFEKQIIVDELHKKHALSGFSNFTIIKHNIQLFFFNFYCFTKTRILSPQYEFNIGKILQVIKIELQHDFYEYILNKIFKKLIWKKYKNALLLKFYSLQFSLSLIFKILTLNLIYLISLIVYVFDKNLDYRKFINPVLIINYFKNYNLKNIQFYNCFSSEIFNKRLFENNDKKYYLNIPLQIF